MCINEMDLENEYSEKYFSFLISSPKNLIVGFCMNIIMFLDRECNSIKNLYESKYCEPRSLRELGNNPKNLLSHLSKS